MGRLWQELIILWSVLLFQIWNVSTAKRRGKIYVSLWMYSKKRDSKSFRAALFMGVVWIVAILAVMLQRIHHFLTLGV